VFYEAEEIASVHNGLARLFAERPEWLSGDVALLGEPTNGDIEAGCQGTMRLQVTMSGVRAHSARPWMGRNAIHRAGAVIERVAAWEGRRPVIEGCEYREALQVVAVSGGVAGNVIPDSCSLTLNHRFAPDRTAAQAESQVREILELDDDDTLEITDVAPAARPGLDHPLLRALIERNDLTVRAKVAWTDVARFAEHGIPASNFGPGDATLAHTADERVERRVIERTYAALAALLTSGA
jgi:succinyl-diaminopimelate desuccinylase